jgi:hypothetical protein
MAPAAWLSHTRIQLSQRCVSNSELRAEVCMQGVEEWLFGVCFTCFRDVPVCVGALTQLDL